MRHSIKLIFMTCILLVTAIFISCKKETPGEPTIGIEDISMENYPRVDGATATWALNRMIACKLLGIDYIWSTAIGGGERGIIADPDQWNGYPNADRDAFSHFLNNRVINSQTHGAFMNLIDGEADIIVVSSHPSPDEKAHAAEAGVTLIETPIAIDAFVFIVNEANPVKDLTIDQIRKIYTKQIINWSQVGGTDSEMKVFTRPRNSGSEETMRALVMGDIEPAEFPESQQVVGMGAVFPEIQGNVDGIS
jgi:phosphate transport system substrate-binding protein